MHVVRKIKRPSGAFPSLPSGVDGLLKKHFDSFREMGELPPELRGRDIDAKLFSDGRLLALWRNSRKGIQYVDRESGIMLMGAVDDVLEKGKKLIVLDYKTRGFPVKEDTAHYYQDQLDVYNFLLRKNGFDTEDYSYLLFFVPKEIREGGDFVFETELVKVPINIGHAERLFMKAVKVLDGDMPEPSAKCEFCRWKKSG